MSTTGFLEIFPDLGDTRDGLMRYFRMDVYAAGGDDILKTQNQIGRTGMSGLPVAICATM
jgi:hypothetical protein